MDLTEQRFYTGDVVKATGISHPNLMAWLHRGYIDIPGPAKPGTGQRRTYDPLTIVQLAIARELVDAYNMYPEQASFIAVAVTRKMPGEPREWLRSVTGNEVWTVMLHPKKSGAKTGGMSYDEDIWIEPERDFSGSTKSALVIGVGAIAKQVLAELEAILKERAES